MRNTTKLKLILSKYSVSLDLEDDGLFKLTMIDKMAYNNLYTIEAKNYTQAISKAYSYMLKQTSPERDLRT